MKNIKKRSNSYYFCLDLIILNENNLRFDKSAAGKSAPTAPTNE
jgi:hypothetical protein